MAVLDSNQLNVLLCMCFVEGGDVESGGVEGGGVESGGWKCGRWRCGSVEGGSVGVRLTLLVGNFCIFSQASICCTCICCHLER